MAAYCFIGDEVSATGFRLAGFSVETPVERDVTDILSTLEADTKLVLITAEYAKKIPRQQLEKLQREGRQKGQKTDIPLILVIPDVNGRKSPEGLDTRVRQLLGIDA